MVSQRNALLMSGFSILMLLPMCSSLSAAYKKHGNIKWHSYGQHICEVEHASLIFSATRGLAHEATIFTSHQVGRQLLWVGFIAVFHFPCCALLLPVSVVLSHHLVTLTEFHPNGSGKGGVSFKGLIYSLGICFLCVIVWFCHLKCNYYCLKKSSS